MEENEWGQTAGSGLIYSSEELGIFDKVAKQHNRKLWGEKRVRDELERFFEVLEHQESLEKHVPWMHKILTNARYSQKIKMQDAMAHMKTFEEKLDFIHGVREDFESTMAETKSVQVMDVVSLYPRMIPAPSLKEILAEEARLGHLVDSIHMPISVDETLLTPFTFKDLDHAVEQTGLSESTIRELWTAGYVFHTSDTKPDGWYRELVRT